MRIRAMIAALAVACSLALCAVPAFATESSTVLIYTSDYGTVSVDIRTNDLEIDDSWFSVGLYRTEQGLQLVCYPQDVIITPTGTWQEFHGQSWSDTTVASSTGVLLVNETGEYRVKFYYDNSDTVNVRFVVTNLGVVGNDQQGIFGIVTEGMHSAVNWLSSYLNGIVTSPILLFFCLALPLLTIGITIIRRLLAVRA